MTILAHLDKLTNQLTNTLETSMTNKPLSSMTLQGLSKVHQCGSFETRNSIVATSLSKKKSRPTFGREGRMSGRATAKEVMLSSTSLPSPSLSSPSPPLCLSSSQSSSSSRCRHFVIVVVVEVVVVVVVVVVVAR